MSHVSNAPFRAPKQARSRHTLTRIVEAATDLVAERGVEETTVQQIVGRAGSSVGSFYARFAGKDDLLDYLEGRVWEDARSHWDEALAAGEWDGLSLADLAQGVVHLLLESSRRAADVRAALRARRGAQPSADEAAAFQARVHEGFRTLMLAHRSEMSHPDPELAIDIGLRVVLGGIRELEGVAELTDEVRVSELARLLRAYLGSDPDAAASTQIDFFDVWA